MTLTWVNKDGKLFQSYYKVLILVGVDMSNESSWKPLDVYCKIWHSWGWRGLKNPFQAYCMVLTLIGVNIFSSILWGFDTYKGWIGVKNPFQVYCAVLTLTGVNENKKFFQAYCAVWHSHGWIWVKKVILSSLLWGFDTHRAE